MRLVDVGNAEAFTVETPGNAWMDTVGGMHWRVYGVPSERISFGMTPNGDADLVASLLGVEPIPDSAGLPGGLSDMALTDLATRLLAGASTAAYTTELHHDDIEANRGNACVRLRVGQTEIRLLLSGTLVERLSPPMRQATGGLQRARSCIQSERVELTAHLDLGFIRLGELMELESGDVLVTNASLGVALGLTVVNGGSMAGTGHLGQSQGRRALVLASIQSSN